MLALPHLNEHKEAVVLNRTLLHGEQMLSCHQSFELTSNLRITIQETFDYDLGNAGFNNSKADGVPRQTRV